MLERPAPLAVQVHQQLLRWIRSGAIGDQRGALPSETEIASLLGVSRATVREALAWLQRDRIIYRRHGSGTYINNAVRKLPFTFEGLVDPAALIAAQGYRPTVDEVAVLQEPLDDEVARALEAEPGGDALLWQGRYLADGAPAAWVEAIIPWQAAPGDPPPSPSSHLGLSQFILTIAGSAGTHSVATLEAQIAAPKLASRLGLEAGTSIIRMEDIHLTDEGSPVFFTRTYCAPGVLKLQMIRKADTAARHLSVW